MRILAAQPTPELPTAQRGEDSHQGMVGASGLRLNTTRRWLLRKFRSQAAQNQWCEKHKHELQIVPLFVDNGYAVEFRKLNQL